jgi:5'-nucleotidase
VLAGLGAFGDPPDLVLSGINRGANAGHAVLHSGTVGAALTAAAGGRSAMAVSLDVLTPGTASAASGGNAIAALDLVDDEARHWATAAGLAGRLLPALREAPSGTVFNLNVPDRPADRVAGVRRGTLSRFGQTQMAIAEAGEGFVRTAVEESGARTEEGTDLALLADGYASITPIQAVGEATGLDIDLDPDSDVPDSGRPVSRVGALDRGR